ncbi:MAG: epoxyqueuosine reductase QueH [Clostridia bacterium]|nr:epoxyqueuosine reductase QueH [Clostridia bacterium]
MTDVINKNTLMHICCGPCSLYCIDEFRRVYPEAALHGLFANPNIHPYDEFLRRAESTAQAANYKGLEVEFLPYFDQAAWENFARPDGIPQIQGMPDALRCGMCYRVRMDLTAKYAKAHGYDSFTSTLFVSPYQDHELLRRVCEMAAAKYGLEFIYIDFRPGFRQGQQEARELGLYRQKYCGCIRSLRGGNKKGRDNK